jgi:hypothetical protein
MSPLFRLLTQPPALIGWAMVMWVVTEIAGARTIGGAFPIPQIVWLRYTFHLALMCLIFGIPRRFDFLRTERPWLQLFRSFLMLVMPLSFALAVQGGRWREVFGVFWIAPILVVAFGALAGERASRFVWLTTILAWLGVIAIYRPSISSLGLATLPTLAMAASFAGYVALTRVLDRTESLLTNLFYSAVSVFVVLTIALPWYWRPLTVRGLIGGFALAVCGWIALCLMDLGLRRDTAARLAPFLFLQVVIEEALRTGPRMLRDTAASGGIILTLIALSLALLFSRRPAAQVAQ